MGVGVVLLDVLKTKRKISSLSSFLLLFYINIIIKILLYF